MEYLNVFLFFVAWIIYGSYMVYMINHDTYYSEYNYYTQTNDAYGSINPFVKYIYITIIMIVLNLFYFML